MNTVKCLAKCTKFNMIHCLKNVQKSTLCTDQDNSMFKKKYKNQHCSMFKNIYTKLNIVQCLQKG